MTAERPVSAYLATLNSHNSRRAMRGCLIRSAELLGLGDYQGADWHRITLADLHSLRDYLAENAAPATVNLHLSAIRGVLHACWTAGLIDHERLKRTTVIKGIRGDTPPAGREVRESELAAVFRFQTDRDPHKETRDLALLGVLYVGGLRRAEAARLKVGEYRLPERCLHVRGKGNRFRTVYLSSQADGLVQCWLGYRGRGEGKLFQLCASSIYMMISRRVKGLGLNHLSPHDLRRTFVGNLLDRGVDLETVRRMAGHADVTTTARYDRRPAAIQQMAAETLELPVGEDGNRMLGGSS